MHLSICLVKLMRVGDYPIKVFYGMEAITDSIPSPSKRISLQPLVSETALSQSTRSKINSMYISTMFVLIERHKS